MAPRSQDPDDQHSAEAAELADEIDRTIDETVDPSASGVKEVNEIVGLYEGDAGFRSLVRRLGKALNIGQG